MSNEKRHINIENVLEQYEILGMEGVKDLFFKRKCSLLLEDEATSRVWELLMHHEEAAADTYIKVLITRKIFN